MAGQADIAKLSLNFSTNIKDSDVESVDRLFTVLEKLDTLNIGENKIKGLETLGKSLKGFNGIKIGANLGKGLGGIIDMANQIADVKDITPFAETLNKNFEAVGKAAMHFNDFTGSNLGKGFGELVNATNKITEVKDITPFAEALNKNFEVVGKAVLHLDEVTAKIPVNLGKGIGGIIDMTNQITDVKDITPFAETLDKNFETVGKAAMHFNEVTAKIPVNMGKGILGIVDATNQISKVQDISGVANRLNNNFYIIAQTTKHFNELNPTDYSGIARLISVMTSISRIKPIGNTVIKNAEKLAKAVNTLTNNVTESTPRINAISKATSTLGARMNTTTKSAHRFNNSMTLVNLAVTIRALRTITSLFRKLIMGIYGTVEAWGEVENTLSFFSQSLGQHAESTAKVIQGYADLGVIDFSKFSNQVAKMTQIYKGYGIASEDAAKMALNLTQLAHDASYALGENGKDIDLWYRRITSVATGQTRAGYYFGVDTSVKALSEGFDELSNNTEKATKTMAAHEAMLKNTTSIQNQMAREINTTYVQMNIFKQRITQLKQSIGYALVPAFQAIIRWGLIAIKVIELLIDAVVKFFGGDGFEVIDYSSFINNTADSVGGLADSADDVADGFGSANKQAKELKKTISGIDQVFTINDVVNDGGAGGAGGVGGVGGISGADLSELTWDFGDEALENLDDINKKAEEIANNIKRAVPWVLAIAAGFAAWKIVNLIGDLGTAIQRLNGISGILGGIGTVIIGVTLTLVGWKIFKTGLDKLLSGEINGISIGMTIGGAVLTGIGLSLTAAGLLKILATAMPNSIFATWATAVGSSIGTFIKVGIGVGLVVGGFALMFAGFKDAFENGLDWKNVGLIVGGLIATGIGIALAANTIKTVIQGSTASANVATTATNVLKDSTSIGRATKAFKMPSWSSIGKTFSIIAGGIVLIIGAVWLIGQIDTRTLKKSTENTELIAKAFGNLALPLAGVLTAAIAIGYVMKNNIVGWKDIAAGLIAIDVGIVNMLAVVLLASLWDTESLKKGQTNIETTGNAFKAIETPLNLLLVKAAVIGAIIVASAGLGALALAIGIVAIDATVVSMIGMTKLASKWDTTVLAKGEENMSVASKAFETINPVLSDLLGMIGKIGFNMSGFAWLTGQSYDFDKALGQLKDTMDSLLHWIGEYSSWDTERLKTGGVAIDLAGKAGSTINTTLKPLLDMIESIGKNTNNIFGLGDYDYEGSLEILKDTMDSLLKWIGDYSSWDTTRLETGGKAIDLAGKAGSTINTTLEPLIDMASGIGKNTNNILGLGDYDYEGALKILKKTMDSLLKWIGDYSTWDTNRLTTGGEAIDLAGQAGTMINEVLSPLITNLTTIGGKTNNIFGLGDYDYDGSMSILKKTMDSMIKWIGGYASWDTSKLEKGGETIELVSPHLTTINTAFEDLLPILNSIGKKTNNIFGIGDYDYNKSMKIVTDTLKTIVKGISDIGSSTNASNVDKGIATINKSKDTLKNLDTFTEKKTSNLAKAGENFDDFASELKSAFATLAKIKTDNVSKIISALNSLDLTKFKNVGVNMAKALTDGLNNYKPSFVTFNDKVKTGLKQNTNPIGVTAARDYVSGINGSNANVSTFTNKIKNSLTLNTKSYGTTVARDVVSGINSHSVVVTTFTNRIKSNLNFSANYIGNNIAQGVINGINAKYVNVTTFTNNVKYAMNRQFSIHSPSRWGISVGENIAQAVSSGINDTRVSFTSFKANVSEGLDGLMNGVNLGMPTLDTGLLSANVSELSQGLSANVRGTFESQVDGTEQAVNRLTNVMTDRIERLITVTEDGKIIEIDGDKIGETSKKYAQQQAIKNNVVFGKR